MSVNPYLAPILEFIGKELLDGRAQDLDEKTPLLEWGIIDSISLAALLSFIRARFGVEVPLNDLVPANLSTPGALAALVLRLRPASS